MDITGQIEHRRYHGPATIITADLSELATVADLTIETHTRTAGRYEWHGLLATGHVSDLLRHCGQLAFLRLDNGRQGQVLISAVHDYPPQVASATVVGVGPAPFGEVGRTP
jgi:hypothetical protein